jgi:hypothetical protein
VSRVYKKTSTRTRKAEAGQAVIESIASIIIFTLMLGLVMCISVYLYFQQAIVTAAREGARQASLNTALGSSGSEQSGIDSVQAYVADEVQKLTGQTFSPTVATINVSPPSASADQTPGKRQVTVSIVWNMANPVTVGNMAAAFGGNADTFNNIPVSASATMRYEE